MLLVEGLVHHDGVGAAVGMGEDTVQGLAWLEVLQTCDGNLVGELHLFVISTVIECYLEHALLLQVGLMNPKKSSFTWHKIPNQFIIYLGKDLTMMARPTRQ